MERAIRMKSVRVFINGSGLEVAADATALEAVTLADREDGEGVRTGRRVITDSRGLAVLPGSPVFGGAIFRTVRTKPDSRESV
jgi:hypothetical protein